MPRTIYDIEGDRTLTREHVFDGKLDGREVILTDSQAGHFRERFTDLQGPFGKLLGVFGSAHVVAVHDENVDKRGRRNPSRSPRCGLESDSGRDSDRRAPTMVVGRRERV